MNTSTEAPAKTLLDLKVGDEVVIEANHLYRHEVGHQTAKVTRVGRLYFYVRLRGRQEEFGFSRENGTEKISTVSRSRVAYTPDDWAALRRRRGVLERVREHGFRYYGPYGLSGVPQSVETLEKIADLLDADKTSRGSN